jgi:hypothetical protein
MVRVVAGLDAWRACATTTNWTLSACVWSPRSPMTAPSTSKVEAAAVLASTASIWSTGPTMIPMMRRRHAGMPRPRRGITQTWSDGQMR